MARSSVALSSYGATGRNQVGNLSVPSQIKCNVCRDTKPSNQFSGNQQNALVAHMRQARNFNPSRDAYAVCMRCTNQQVVELECYYCDKTKGLDKFPKAQRSKPDTAECWSCQQERLGYEPEPESGDNESDRAGDSDDSGEDYSLSSVTGGASLPTDMDQLSLSQGPYASHSSTSGTTGGVGLSRASQSGGTFASATSSGPARSSASQSNGTSRGLSSNAPSVASGSASSSRTVTNGGNLSSFNPNGYGNPYSQQGRRAPASEAGSTRSTPTASGGGKFAKVKAVPRKIVYDKAEEEREQERQKKQNAADVSDDEVEYAQGSDSDDE